MTEQEIAKNEAVLRDFLDRADKQFSYRVGLTALALLTEHFPPDQFENFLSDCVDNAVEMHRNKMLGANKTAKPGVQEQAPAPAATGQPL